MQNAPPNNKWLKEETVTKTGEHLEEDDEIPPIQMYSVWLKREL